MRGLRRVLPSRADSDQGGGFLWPFRCGWFIREYLLGKAHEGSQSIDPERGAA